jgi:tetratricopeptide (TPR) repeat protein
MLETIREYAGERLEESDATEETRQRHAEWFAGFVERTLGHLGDGTPRERASAEVARDHDNVRDALGWCWASGRDDLGLMLGASATRYWCDGGYFKDADAWLHEAMPRISAASHEVQFEALKAATMIEAWVHGDATASGSYAERALILAAGLERPRERLWLTQARAAVLWEGGDLDGARTLFERSLAGYRELGDRVGEAGELHHLGELHRDAGNYDLAAEFLGAAVALYRELGEEVGFSHALHGLGDLALDRDDLEVATTCYREALEVAREPRGQRYCLAGIASVLARRGRALEAATLWGAVASGDETLGTMFPSERARYEKDLGLLRGTPEWTAGLELPLESGVQYALVSLDVLDPISGDRSGRAR